MPGWKIVEDRQGFRIMALRAASESFKVPVFAVQGPGHGLVHYFACSARASEFAAEAIARRRGSGAR
jgi:hypothetical protein